MNPLKLYQRYSPPASVAPDVAVAKIYRWYNPGPVRSEVNGWPAEFRALLLLRLGVDVCA